MEVVNRPPRRDEVWLVTLDPTHGAENDERLLETVAPNEFDRKEWKW